MSKSGPSRLEDHLGYWLRCLSNFVSRSFAERLEKQGITVAQWVVLRVLYDRDELTLNEAARAVGVDKSTLSRMIERLVQKQWVNRSEGPDRRSLGLSLSAQGRKVVLLAAKSADENDEAFFKTLSRGERGELLGVIKQLLKSNGWDSALRGRDRME